MWLGLDTYKYERTFRIFVIRAFLVRTFSWRQFKLYGEYCHWSSRAIALLLFDLNFISTSCENYFISLFFSLNWPQNHYLGAVNLIDLPFRILEPRPTRSNPGRFLPLDLRCHRRLPNGCRHPGIFYLGDVVGFPD